ncbi:nucleotide sugar dehydrogenase, partial [Aureimonas leprariae]
MTAEIAANLIERIRNRDYTVGIIGLGYVGIPLALTACRAGFRVIGFD